MTIFVKMSILETWQVYFVSLNFRCSEKNKYIVHFFVIIAMMTMRYWKGKPHWKIWHKHYCIKNANSLNKELRIYFLLKKFVKSIGEWIHYYSVIVWVSFQTINICRTPRPHSNSTFRCPNLIDYLKHLQIVNISMRSLIRKYLQN